MSLTLEEYAAVHAPNEIPEWFMHSPEIVQPEVRVSSRLVYGFDSDHNYRDVYNKYYDQEECKFQVKITDDPFSSPISPFKRQEIETYFREVEDYDKQRDIEFKELQKWQDIDKISRYFQWRIYFAKQIESRLSKH